MRFGFTCSFLSKPTNGQPLEASPPQPHGPTAPRPMAHPGLRELLEEQRGQEDPRQQLQRGEAHGHEAQHRQQGAAQDEGPPMDSILAEWGPRSGPWAFFFWAVLGFLLSLVWWSDSFFFGGGL